MSRIEKLAEDLDENMIGGLKKKFLNLNHIQEQFLFMYDLDFFLFDLEKLKNLKK